MKNKPNEKYAEQELNSRSLHEAYAQVTQPIDGTDTELGSEFRSEQNKVAQQKVGSASNALLETYAQAIDSYRQGTIDQAEDPED